MSPRKAERLVRGLWWFTRLAWLFWRVGLMKERDAVTFIDGCTRDLRDAAMYDWAMHRGPEPPTLPEELQRGALRP